MKDGFTAARDALHFINGAFTEGTSGRTFDNISPATGKKIGVVHEGLAPEIDAAVTAARAALRGPWGYMTQAERSDMLYAVADGINARFDDFLDAETLDTGKPRSLAKHVDIPRGAANFKVFADLVKNV